MEVKGGVGFSSVVVANRRLFTMGHDGQKRGGKETVYCLDAKIGKPIWTDSYAAPLVDYLHEGGPVLLPTVDGNTVYTISKHGLLHAYQTSTGKKVWTKDMMAVSSMRKVPEWGFAALPIQWETFFLLKREPPLPSINGQEMLCGKVRIIVPPMDRQFHSQAEISKHIAVLRQMV